MNNFYKNLSMWLVIGLTAVVLVKLLGTEPDRQSVGSSVDMGYSQFLLNVESGAINRVMVKGDKLVGTTVDGRPFVTMTPRDSELMPLLRKSGVDITVKEPDRESLWLS